ncbi:MAG TPA: enoyl-CoA hydratase/isomerase family protein [Nocardioidaceae bacterium]|nr:enoyl-CoA hydratase/isomerase family protein [Nocardioidaceae bacterium]
MAADERAASGGGIRHEVVGTTATLTLDRPESRNAQTPAMWAAMRHIGETLPADVRIVIVRSEGPSFSAGLDKRMWTSEGIPGEPSLVSMAEMEDADLLDLLASFQDAFSWLRRPEIVSIAAVQGHAVGAGFQLALACDFRVLTEDARFAMRETSLGLVPDLGGTHPLVEAIGYPRALEICVTGRWIDADEARKLGLATIVVDHDDMDGTVDDLAGAVLASPRNAVASTKALLRGAVTRDHDEQLLAERVAQVGRIHELAAFAAAQRKNSD